MTATTAITHLNGVEVIAIEPGIGTHPRYPDRPSKRTGVSKLLLADGTETHICDDCHEFTHENADNVANHRGNAHLRGPAKPHTKPETIKAVIRAVERARQSSGRDYAVRAAAALTLAQVQSAASGTAWTSQMVSNIYNTYHLKPGYKVRVPRVKTDRARARLPEQRQSLDYVGTEKALLVQMRDRLREILELVEQMVAAPPPPLVIDQELAEKAAKYDRMRDQMRGLLG